jgi:hypothetical protein
MKVYLSVISKMPFDFESAVWDFIKAKKDHLLTEGFPAPAAPNAMVENAVRRIPGYFNSDTDFVLDDFAPDYEIIDDMPAPSLNLPD